MAYYYANKLNESFVLHEAAKPKGRDGKPLPLVAEGDFDDLVEMQHEASEVLAEAAAKSAYVESQKTVAKFKADKVAALIAAGMPEAQADILVNGASAAPAKSR